MHDVVVRNRRFDRGAAAVRKQPATAAGLTGAVLAAVLAASEAAAAQTPPATAGPPPVAVVEQIRQELAALRDEYTRRIAALEARLAVVEVGGSPAQQPPPVPAPTAPPSTAEAAVPPGAAGAGGPSGSLPLYGAAAATSKVFNPDIAVIGDFLAAAGENGVDPTPTLEMHEAEASFQAIVDPYARADFFFAFGPEGVEIEEGFLSFPTLPAGLLGKAGKLRAAFGRVNTFHNHVLPWTDRPLVTRNLVGGEEGIGDAGISLSRLVPNPAFFLEATAEVYRGESELFQAPRRRDLTYLGRLRAYRDLTESVNLDVGGSFVHGHNDQGPGFTTRLFGIDATFRYRPLRRAIYRRLVARTELVWSRREQEEGTERAFGTYVSADYQLARRWFVGGRYDYAERAEDAALADKGGSLLLTFWPSEFSQVRAQLRRTRFAEGETATEVLFQLLFSIGAHGAHPF